MIFTQEYRRLFYVSENFHVSEQIEDTINNIESKDDFEISQKSITTTHEKIKTMLADPEMEEQLKQDIISDINIAEKQMLGEVTKEMYESLQKIFEKYKAQVDIVVSIALKHIAKIPPEEWANIGADLSPAGILKGFIEALIGKNALGDDLDWLDRTIGIFPGVKHVKVLQKIFQKIDINKIIKEVQDTLAAQAERFKNMDTPITEGNNIQGATKMEMKSQKSEFSESISSTNIPNNIASFTVAEFSNLLERSYWKNWVDVSSDIATKCPEVIEGNSFFPVLSVK